MNYYPDDPAVAHITEALRAYIVAEDALRKNPQSWKSSPPPQTPEGEEYHRLRDVHYKATADLWMQTDIEYANGFRAVIWWWRYWKVQARKCCHYQQIGKNQYAADVMQQLHMCEAAMVEACGLSEIYRSPGSYIAEQFPNLKKENERDQSPG